MDTSVSADSASLASVHSRRTAGHRRQHGRIGLVQPVERLRQPGSTTCSNTSSSKSMPPSRSTPSGPAEEAEARARSLWTTAASNVPPPKSYTAIVEPGSTRSAAA